MSRKKAAAEAVSDTPDVFDEAIAAQNAAAAQAVVENVAESTHLPELARELPSATKSHAEAVEKKKFKPAPDPFDFADDYVAGVHLSESKRYKKMLIAFDEKPSAEVTAKLKEAAFRWEPLEKVWTRELGLNPLATRIKAEEVFKEVSKQIRTERGIEHSAGISI